MKKVFTIFFLAGLIFQISLAFGHDKVVVIPLNSPKPQPIAQIHAIDSGGILGDYSNPMLKLNIVNPNSGPSLYAFWVDTSSAGQTFKFDQTNNPDFNAAKDLLVNGIDETLWFGMSTAGDGAFAMGNLESLWIKGWTCRRLQS